MPCYMCWDHTADEPLLRLMLDKARRRQGNAFPNLMKLGDPSCAPILRRLLDDPDPGMRQLAVVALGWSGDAADVALVGRLALDDVDRVRMAALATLAELGGPNAGEVLWRCAQGRTGRERQLALRALAWLADPRARPALLESMPDWLGVEDSQDHAKALLRVAEPQDLDALVEWVQQAAHLIGTGQISPERLKQAFEAVHQAVAAVMPERLENMANRLRDVPELLVDLGYYWMGRIHARRPAGPRPLAVPLGDRLVPSQPLIYGMQAPASDGEPLAKFRGQPQWRAEPTWPIGPHGPLAFYGQLPLAEHRTAYLFVGESDSWQPLGPGNALVVQPGPLPHLPTQPMRQGPQIYEWRPETPARFRRRARRLPAPEIPVALIDWTAPAGMGLVRGSEPLRHP